MIEDTLNRKYNDCLTGLALTDKGLKIPAGLDVYENTTSLVLSKIVVNEKCKGSGVGTQIMNELIDYADHWKQIIALTPSSDFGGNEMRLVQFYKRFGFRMTSREEKELINHTMIRKPIQPGQKRINEDKMGKDIKCNKCGWSWDKDDTEAHDMYVCHKCGNDNSVKENKSGLTKVPTKKEIIEKFKIDSSELDKEIEMGIKIELEHTESKEMAEKIAMQHLIEMPDYYTRLKGVEKEGEKFWKEKLKESVAKELRKLI